MAADAIKTVSHALETGLAEKGEKVTVWAYKSDYKDFIRMYVMSEYFRGMPEKQRLDEIYSMLESHGARAFVGKISLCIAMTKREYQQEFGGDVWLGDLPHACQDMKPPRVHRQERSHDRN